MKQVLLTVSGNIAQDIETQIEQGARPRADYLEMARSFDADLLDYQQARQQTNWVGHLLAVIGGPNLLLAWVCFLKRHHYQVIFTDGEQVGMPLAIFLRAVRQRRVRHLMIAHILSVPKKTRLFSLLGLQHGIDLFFVYSTWQKRFIEQRWQIPSDRVVLVPFMVDSTFFSPRQVVAQPRPMICAVGLEYRDYPTLLEAVHDLPIEVVIAAASPWSKRKDTTQDQIIPTNVTVKKFSQYELRQLYADACFVVMPLYDVPFQAGVTAILEAMAMGKAVICTQTPGQTDVVVDGVTGLYVPPGDAGALRNAIEMLLADPERAARMGQAGRERIETEMSLECYTAQLQRHVQHARRLTEKHLGATAAIHSLPLL